MIVLAAILGAYYVVVAVAVLAGVTADDAAAARNCAGIVIGPTTIAVAEVAFVAAVGADVASGAGQESVGMDIGGHEGYWNYGCR